MIRAFLSNINQHSRKSRSVFLLIILIKLVVFFGLWTLEGSFLDDSAECVGLFFYGNDTHSYLDPIESIVDNGTYSMASGPTAFRMPGLLPFYGPLYLIFGKWIGLHLLVFVNFMFDVLGAIMLWQILMTLFRPIVALLSISAYALFPRIAALGYLGVTETITAFFFIFLIWSILRWRGRGGSKYLWFVSLALSALVFLKPASGVILPFVLGYFIWVERQHINVKSLGRLMRIMLIVTSIPILTLSCWTVRNYYAFDSFIPLTSAFGERSVTLKFKEFCRTTGSEFQAWNGKDAQAWFAPPNNYLYNVEFQKTDPFNAYVYSENLSWDTLAQIRSNWHASIDKTLSEQERMVYQGRAYAGFDRAINTFKRESSFSYLVTSRLTLVYGFIMIKDSFSPFKESAIPFLLIRLWFLASYFLIVLAGIAGVILALVNRQQKLVLPFMVLATFLLAHVMIGIVENRYLLPVIPIFLIFMGNALNFAWRLGEKKFNQ